MAKTKRAWGPTGAGNGPRKLVAQTFVSLDGVMQAPGAPDEDRESDFRHGGWSMTFWDETMAPVMQEFLSQPADVVLGRKTYDIFARYWPTHRDQMGSVLNDVTKYVASRTKRKLEWEHSEQLDGDAVRAVKELKGRPGPPLHVVGSGNLLQTFLKHDLVDELDLWIFPVVVGSGKRLFEDGAIPTAWKLTSSRTSGSGVLMLHYDRAGEILYAGQPPGT